MSKSNSSEKIYALLRQYIPEEYPALKTVPRLLPHPGDCPRGPVKTESMEFTVTKDSDFSKFVKKLEEIKLRGKSSVEFFISREVVGTETLYDPYDDYEYQSDIYGDAYKVQFLAVVDTEGLYQKNKRYEADVKAWHRKIEARRERKILIEAIEKENKTQLSLSRKKNPEIWNIASKSLSGKLDGDFKNIVREFLIRRLAALDED